MELTEHQSSHGSLVETKAPHAAHGSMAALRAERARKKREAEQKDNILMNDRQSDSEQSGGPKHRKLGSLSSKADCEGMIDEYGFLMTEEQKAAKMAFIRSASYRKKVRTQRERIFKWQHMLEHWDSYTSTKKAKLKSRIRKGIPSSYRPTVWLKLMDVPPLTAERRQQYAVRCDANMRSLWLWFNVESKVHFIVDLKWNLESMSHRQSARIF